MVEAFLILGSFPTVLLPWFCFVWRSFGYEKKIKEEASCQLDCNFMFQLVFIPQEFKYQYRDRITPDLMDWLIRDSKISLCQTCKYFLILFLIWIIFVVFLTLI
jgi:hypothetical protein